MKTVALALASTAVVLCGGAVAQAEPLDYGVVETTRVPVPPQSQTCPVPEPAPGTQRVTFGRDGAPEVQVLIPDSWRSAVAQDDSALTLTGADGVTGSVTVTPTDLGPAEAFQQYADVAQAKAPISSQNILPAELCGYSGQELRGMWSGDPLRPAGSPVRYADRLAHVWTNGVSYLVAIHVQGPKDAASLPAAEDLLMGEFGIKIP